MVINTKTYNYDEKHEYFTSGGNNEFIDYMINKATESTEFINFEEYLKELKKFEKILELNQLSCDAGIWNNVNDSDNILKKTWQRIVNLIYKIFGKTPKTANDLTPKLVNKILENKDNAAKFSNLLMLLMRCEKAMLNTGTVMDVMYKGVKLEKNVQIFKTIEMLLSAKKDKTEDELVYAIINQGIHKTSFIFGVKMLDIRISNSNNLIVIDKDYQGRIGFNYLKSFVKTYKKFQILRIFTTYAKFKNETEEQYNERCPNYEIAKKSAIKMIEDLAFSNRVPDDKKHLLPSIMKISKDDLKFMREYLIDVVNFSKDKALALSPKEELIKIISESYKNINADINNGGNHNPVLIQQVNTELTNIMARTFYMSPKNFHENIMNNNKKELKNISSEFIQNYKDLNSKYKGEFISK